MPKRTGIFQTLVNRDGLYTVWWATWQQLVVAFSTYAIVAAIRAANGAAFDEAVQWAVAFVASLIIVFIPNTLSVVYLQKWRLESFARFVNTFIERNAGRTSMSHSRDKVQHESWLTNEGAVVFAGGTQLLYDLYQILMSTVLNVAVIAVLIDPRISVWYVIAGVVLLIANLFFRGVIARASQAMQDSRRDLSNVMLSAWENIFVGNAYNLKLWQSRFHERIGQSKQMSVAYDRKRMIVSSCAMTAALFIIAIGNGIFLSENRGDIAALSALLVTLPRQLQVVQNIFASFGFYMSWQGLAGQFRALENILNLDQQAKDTTTFIQLREIQVTHQNATRVFEDLSALKQSILEKQNGRFTLRGKNGAGKSTLLAWIAENTGAESFYLPSQYVDLAFGNSGIVAHSDGNRILQIFEDREAFEGVRVILLDEWDANLDAQNVQLINSAIEKLAAERIVIESRHRA